MARVALITGGAQGIGAGCARKLVQNGFSGLVLIDRNEKLLQQQAETLKGLAKVSLLAADLRDDETPGKAVALAINDFGRIDLLLNAAGDTSRGSVADTSLETYHQLFDVNVKAPLFLMQVAAKAMAKQKSGTIINIASMIAYGGPPNLATYGATKAALLQLTKHAAHSYAWDGIRCFAVALGWAFTEGEQQRQTTTHAMPADWSKEIGEQTPSGRLISPDDIADLVVYLCSPSAQMMNGAVIDFEQLPLGVFRQHPILKDS